MTARRSRPLILAVSVCLVTLLISTGTAAAQPIPATVETGSAVPIPLALPAEALAKIPAALVRFTPGTPDFNARYFGVSRSVIDQEGLGYSPADAAVAAGGPGCADRGGDVGLYVTDIMRQWGSVISAVADLSGKAMDYTTTPWPGVKAPGSANMAFRAAFAGEQLSATIDAPAATEPKPYIPNPLPVSSCAQELAPFGQGSPESPWGFTFYPEPDQGSIDAFIAELAATPARSGAEAGLPEAPAGILSGAQTMEVMHTTYDNNTYSPLNFAGYCTQPENPMCISAMFLHCPAAGRPAAADCQRFNANTMKLNIDVANWVSTATEGSEQFLAWSAGMLRTGAVVGSMFAIFGVVAAVVVACVVVCTAAVGMAVAAAAEAGGFGALAISMGSGLLSTLGLRNLILIVAGITLGAPAAIGALLETIKCADNFGKCMAAYGGDGMISALTYIPQAIAESNVPDMQTVAWSSLFNRIAGVAAALLVLFFLIALATAIIRLKPGDIVPSLLGLVSWGFAMGVGGFLITSVIFVRDWITTALAGGTSGAGSPVAAGFSANQNAAFTALITAEHPVGLLGIGALGFIGTMLGYIVNAIIWASNQWIPLAIAIVLLQTAGMAGPKSTRKWVGMGIGLLWTLLLAKPMTMLVFRAGDATIASGTGFFAVLGGVMVLLTTVVAFIFLPRLFALGEGGPLGVGKAMAAAMGIAIAGGRIATSGRGSSGASTAPGSSRTDLNRGTAQRAEAGAEIGAGRNGSGAPAAAGGGVGSGLKHPSAQPDAAAGGPDDPSGLTDAAAGTETAALTLPMPAGGAGPAGTTPNPGAVHPDGSGAGVGGTAWSQTSGAEPSAAAPAGGPTSSGTSGAESRHADGGSGTGMIGDVSEPNPAPPAMGSAGPPPNTGAGSSPPTPPRTGARSADRGSQAGLWTTNPTLGPAPGGGRVAPRPVPRSIGGADGRDTWAGPDNGGPSDDNSE